MTSEQIAALVPDDIDIWRTLRDAGAKRTSQAQAVDQLLAPLRQALAALSKAEPTSLRETQTSAENNLLKPQITPAGKYRKTALIEAVQWFKMGDHPAVVIKSGMGGIGESIPWIETLEGGHIVTPGDWIATGVKGEHWPIKPDVFIASYEPADAAPQRTAEQEREDTLAFLRKQAIFYGPDKAAAGCDFAVGFDMAADAIERGEHTGASDAG